MTTTRICITAPTGIFISSSSPSVLFFSRPRSECWPHHARTFSIYPCPLSFWLTLPRRVLSTSRCCPPRPCVAFLAFVHMALCLAFSLSPGNPLFPHGVTIVAYASFLALTVSDSSLFTPALFSLLSTKPAESFSVLSSQRRPDVFLHSFWQSSFHSRMLLQATLTLQKRNDDKLMEASRGPSVLRKK